MGSGSSKKRSSATKQNDPLKPSTTAPATVHAEQTPTSPSHGEGTQVISTPASTTPASTTPATPAVAPKKQLTPEQERIR